MPSSVRRVVMPADLYATLTNDYFFHAYAMRRELTSLLPEDTTQARILPFQPQMVIFIDP